MVLVKADWKWCEQWRALRRSGDSVGRGGLGMVWTGADWEWCGQGPSEDGVGIGGVRMVLQGRRGVLWARAGWKWCGQGRSGDCVGRGQVGML